MIQPKRLSVKGGKGFTSSGVAKTTKIQMPKMSSKPIVTKGFSENLQTMDKKAPFGNRYFLGQSAKQFGVFPKLRKKPMKKTASPRKFFYKLLGLNEDAYLSTVQKQRNKISDLVKKKNEMSLDEMGLGSKKLNTRSATQREIQNLIYKKRGPKDSTLDDDYGKISDKLSVLGKGGTSEQKKARTDLADNIRYLGYDIEKERDILSGLNRKFKDDEAATGLARTQAAIGVGVPSAGFIGYGLGRRNKKKPMKKLAFPRPNYDASSRTNEQLLKDLRLQKGRLKKPTSKQRRTEGAYGAIINALTGAILHKGKLTPTVLQALAGGVAGYGATPMHLGGQLGRRALIRNIKGEASKRGLLEKKQKPLLKTASSFKLKALARKYFPGVGQFSKGSQKVRGSEFLKKKEWPETGATEELFNILDGQKQYLNLLKSKKRFKDKSLEEIQGMLKAEGKRDQRIGTLKAGTTLSIPALGYYGKKSMDKKAFRMPKPKLRSPNRGTFRMKKPRPKKAKVPNFMKKIVGFQQLPTYKAPKSGMTKFLQKRFKI